MHNVIGVVCLSELMVLEPRSFRVSAIFEYGV